MDVFEKELKNFIDPWMGLIDPRSSTEVKEEPWIPLEKIQVLTAIEKVVNDIVKKDQGNSPIVSPSLLKLESPCTITMSTPETPEPALQNEAACSNSKLQKRSIITPKVTKKESKNAEPQMNKKTLGTIGRSDTVTLSPIQPYVTELKLPDIDAKLNSMRKKCYELINLIEEVKKKPSPVISRNINRSNTSIGFKQKNFLSPTSTTPTSRRQSLSSPNLKLPNIRVTTTTEIPSPNHLLKTPTRNSLNISFRCDSQIKKNPKYAHVQSTIPKLMKKKN